LLPYDNVLDEDELVTELRVPVASAGEGSAYRKLKRKVGDYAMVGAAARLALDDGVVSEASVALTAVDITNVAVPEAGEHLVGERPSGERFRDAGEMAAEAANPETDEHGSARYKSNMTRVLTQHALADALERASHGRAAADGGTADARTTDGGTTDRSTATSGATDGSTTDGGSIDDGTHRDCAGGE